MTPDSGGMANGHRDNRTANTTNDELTQTAYGSLSLRDAVNEAVAGVARLERHLLDSLRMLPALVGIVSHIL